MKITDIQFFDQSFEVQTNENEFETVNQYSANLVIDNKFIVQFSGNDTEAEPLSIPTSSEAFWNKAENQDTAYNQFEEVEIEQALESMGYENNYNFLKEAATEIY